MANSTTGLRLSDETKARLDELGKSRDRSPHYLMTRAIERFLSEEEAVESERRLVNERWQKFELTGETLDHSQVRVWAADIKTDSDKR